MSESIFGNGAFSSTLQREEINNDDVIEQNTAATNYMWDSHNQEPVHSIIFLSLIWAGNKLALSYYDVETCEMYLLPDNFENEEFEYLKMALIQIEPTHIITSVKQDLRLKVVLCEYRDSDLGKAKNVQIQTVPSINFVHEISRKRVLSLLKMPLHTRNFTDKELSIYIASILPQDATELVRCLGALLNYIIKQPLGLNLDCMDNRVPVVGVQLCSLHEIMQVDSNVYSSLQIFKSDLHPSVYKASGSKEGLSIYGIANRTKSTVGSNLLKLWFMRPCKRIETIKMRQDIISYLINPKLNETLSSLQNSLRNVANVNKLFSKMIETKLSHGDWSKVYKTASNGMHIIQICRNFQGIFQAFQQLSDDSLLKLQEIVTLIDQAVDFEESKNQSRCIVKPLVDSNLDEKKRIYNSLPDLMTSIARQELETLEANFDQCNIVYLPQIGFLLTTPLSTGMTDPKDFDYPGLVFYFVSDQVVHYKSAKTQELDEKLGDVHCDIIDIESNILQKLQEAILDRADVLRDLLEFAAVLDCLIALTLWAKENNLVKPTIVEDNIIEVKKGRHPLQELCVCPFIPNDFSFKVKEGRIKIITGPNASGKSIFLKQIGIIVYLAHLGSYVPAESAIIGIVDKIFTRIQSVETVAVDMSAFLIELEQVSFAIKGATKRSLVILDEFGKGTETSNGISIMTATLKYWLAMAENSPFVLASTHFHNIVEQKLLPSTNLLEYLTMEVIQNDSGRLIFLYRVMLGYAKHSFACNIGNQEGIPQKVTLRSHKITQLIRENKSIPIRDDVNEHINFSQCKEIVDRFISLDLDSCGVNMFIKQLAVDYKDV